MEFGWVIMALAEDCTDAETYVAIALGPQTMREVVQLLEEEIKRSIAYAYVAYSMETPGDSEWGTASPIGLYIGHAEGASRRWADVYKSQYAEV